MRRAVRSLCTVQPQILGHEFAGEVIEVGRGVKDLKPGDRVLCDQGRNCWSEGREQLCSYCASGDSHQCQYYREHGIMGLPGAMAEYLSITAVNCIRLGNETSFEQGALAEPVACITHSSDRVDRSASRYTFGGLEEHGKGGERIRNVLIFGAGPAGLLFLQYLRNVKRFEGLIFVADLREQNLKFVAQFGGTPVNVARVVWKRQFRIITKGERIHYLIEACGNGAVYKLIPGLLRKQGTLLIYGAGHRAGNDLNLLDPIAFVEPTLVFSIGASGGFDPDGRPTIYRRSLELVSSGQVQVLPSLPTAIAHSIRFIRPSRRILCGRTTSRGSSTCNETSPHHKLPQALRVDTCVFAFVPRCRSAERGVELYGLPSPPASALWSGS